MKCDCAVWSNHKQHNLSKLSHARFCSFHWHNSLPWNIQQGEWICFYINAQTSQTTSDFPHTRHQIIDCVWIMLDFVPLSDSLWNWRDQSWLRRGRSELQQQSGSHSSTASFHSNEWLTQLVYTDCTETPGEDVSLLKVPHVKADSWGGSVDDVGAEDVWDMSQCSGLETNSSKTFTSEQTFSRLHWLDTFSMSRINSLIIIN